MAYVFRTIAIVGIMSAISPVHGTGTAGNELVEAALSSASSLTAQAASEISKQLASKMTDQEKAALALKIAQELAAQSKLSSPKQ
jgi:hypothetical protein